MPDMYEPLEDRIIVREIKETKTENGLEIPESSVQRLVKGEVLAVGPGRSCEFAEIGSRFAMPVNVGDTVLYGKFAAEALPETDDLFIFPVREVLAVLS